MRSSFHLRIPVWSLTLACIVAVSGYLLLLTTRNRVPYPLQTTQLAASELMQKAVTDLESEVSRRGIPVEADVDPNKTGLIGPEWTQLTTTLGIVEAKRSTWNPNFAALMVKYFHDAGLKEGDVVAVGTSGSFPGLLVATLCATKAMGLKAKVIASYGSSMYGATRVEFTVVDFLQVLRRFSDFSLLAVSPGGYLDGGESNLYEDAREVIKTLALASGVEFISYEPPDVEKSIARRLELFSDVDCFVNVGGASPNSGTSSYTLDFPQGLVLEPPRIPTTRDRGLMYEYAARGVPVVNLLNVRLLADVNGLPYDPVPLPAVGEGGVYWIFSYNRWILLSSILLPLFLLYLGFRKRKG